MWSLFRKKERKSKVENEAFGNTGNSTGEDMWKSEIEPDNGLKTVGDIFSFEKDKEEEDNEHNSEKLSPICFSNGKTQEDVAKEVLKEIEGGRKIIFIRGVCGTGKSAIALNIAKHFDKSSIVVPIKSLQEQYEKDYTHDKFLMKKNKKLKISVIKGRQNFFCPHLGGYADGQDLPCLIEIREKNMDKILKYIKENPYVNYTDFGSIQNVKRLSIAPSCGYWSPLFPSEVNSEVLKKANKRSYKTVSGKNYSLFLRKKGCEYYDQYNSYIDSDVLIFNSEKFLIELAIGRKPETDVDIIDECDDFLDSLTEEKTINISRLHTALSGLAPKSHSDIQAIKEMIHILNEFIYSDLKEKNFADIKKIESSKVKELIELTLAHPYLAEDNEKNYYNSIVECFLEFEPFISDTYMSMFKSFKELGKTEPTVLLSLVTINLQKRFGEIINKSKALVLMSGTLHSEKVLRDIFGIEDYKIIDAETENPGTITKFRTGKEINCKYENLKNKREEYLRAFNHSILQAKLPLLVHITSFSDLPNEWEKSTMELDYLPTRDSLILRQTTDKNNREVDKFKRGEIPILFTTKCSRGVDFPGEKCNSVILTRYPYPDINSLFWKILKKEQPNKFMEFYMDKAKRELLQKIYRALRFKEDHVLLLSPDSRVLDTMIKDREKERKRTDMGGIMSQATISINNINFYIINL